MASKLRSPMLLKNVARNNQMEAIVMKLPLQIAFHNMDRSKAIEEVVRNKASALDRFAGDIMSCHVVVDRPHSHHRDGRQYQVRIDIKVTGEEIAITREPSEHTEYSDINIAIRDAFDSAKRKLEDYERCKRGQVKHHETLPHAQVSSLHPEEGYGFIATPDGREIYFHRHSVLDGSFDDLRLGAEVTFVEEPGRKGPQASTVKPVGKHHHL